MSEFMGGAAWMDTRAEARGENIQISPLMLWIAGYQAPATTHQPNHINGREGV